MTSTTSALTVPLAFSRRNSLPASGITVLAGDIGGTKTNLAFFRATQQEVKLLYASKYPSADYHSLLEIIQVFLSEAKQPGLPDRLCMGVAGPVLNGKVELTNLNWELDCAEMSRQTNVKDVMLLNDLESTAYGLAALQPEDYISIHHGQPGNTGNMAIIAPGTGLGEAGLYWDKRSYHPFPTEGGHCDFSPRTDLDMELCKYLQLKYEVVSWEKVIAGPGIVDLYEFLRDVKKKEEPSWLAAELAELDEDRSAAISHAAIQQKAAICVETMDLYIRYLARETSNLVLKMKATGGVFLGGGIPPKIAPLLQQESFYRHYMDCDRMQHLLETVAIRIIRNDKAGLLGAAWYGAYGEFN